MAEPGILLTLAAIAFSLLLFYWFYGWAHRAFRRVGFSNREAGLILLGSLIGSGFNLPIGVVNDWLVAVNVGGAIVPLVVVYLLFKRIPGLKREAFAGVPVVALVTYLVTDVTAEGIVSPFPLWILPAAAAATVSLAAFWTDEGHAAPLAYISGTLGTLIGADVFRLDDFLAQAPPESLATAAIGGAAVFDMVFLTGILAVGLDTLLFRYRRREAIGYAIPFEEPMAFTPHTPAEVIAAYDPLKDSGVKWGRDEAVAQPGGGARPR